MAIWPGREPPGSQHRGAQVPAVRGQGQASVVQVGRGMSWQNSTWKGYQSAVLGSEFTETLPYPFSELQSPHLYSWGMGGGLGNSETCFSDILGCYDFPQAAHHAKALWTGV